MQVKKVYSASEIDSGADLLPAERRTLTRAGVLKPARTAAGHAIYGEDDMDAGRAYRLANPKRKPKKKR